MRGFVIWKIFRIANGYLSVVEVRGVYGLPSEHWKAIYRIFYAQGARLRWVKLFGSRARGWKQGLVQEAEAWLDMLEKRNLSAHTYNEQTTQMIYVVVKGKYFAMLATLDGEVAARLKVMQEVFR